MNRCPLAAEYLVYEMAKPVAGASDHVGCESARRAVYGGSQVCQRINSVRIHIRIKKFSRRHLSDYTSVVARFYQTEEGHQYTHYLRKQQLLSSTRSALLLQTIRKGRKLELVIEGLLSNHVTIENSRLMLMLDDFVAAAVSPLCSRAPSKPSVNKKQG